MRDARLAGIRMVPPEVHSKSASFSFARRCLWTTSRVYSGPEYPSCRNNADIPDPAPGIGSRATTARLRRCAGSPSPRGNRRVPLGPVLPPASPCRLARATLCAKASALPSPRVESLGSPGSVAMYFHAGACAPRSTYPRRRRRPPRIRGRASSSCLETATASSIRRPGGPSCSPIDPPTGRPRDLVSFPSCAGGLLLWTYPSRSVPWHPGEGCIRPPSSSSHFPGRPPCPPRLPNPQV